MKFNGMNLRSLFGFPEDDKGTPVEVKSQASKDLSKELKDKGFVPSPFQPTRSARSLSNDDMEAIKKLLGVKSVFIVVDTEEYTCTPETCVGHKVSMRSTGFSEHAINGFIIGMADDLQNDPEFHIHNENCRTPAEMKGLFAHLSDVKERMKKEQPEAFRWLDDIAARMAKGDPINPVEVIKEFNKKFPEACKLIEKMARAIPDKGL